MIAPGKRGPSGILAAGFRSVRCRILERGKRQASGRWRWTFVYILRRYDRFILHREIAMKKMIALSLLAFSVFNLAYADTAAHQSEQLARFSRFAGVPTDKFTMVDMYQWQVVGPQFVVIWPTIKQAFLVTVDQPRSRLQWTHALGVTQSQKWTVSRRFDFVTAGGDRCRIVEMRPIDIVAMRKAEPDGSQANRK
jgi:hypothetical protein